MSRSDLEHFVLNVSVQYLAVINNKKIQLKSRRVEKATNHQQVIKQVTHQVPMHRTLCNGRL